MHSVWRYFGVSHISHHEILLLCNSFDVNDDSGAVPEDTMDWDLFNRTKIL